MMNDLEQRFLQHVSQRRLLLPGQRLLVAVSGGPDSVTLFHLLHTLGWSVVVAHINHQLRGQQSDADEAFVRQLAQSDNVPFECRRVNTLEYASLKKLSLQQAARHLRYEALEQLRRQYSLQRIVTAHHADDSIETVLLNLFRGTGIKGLAGIPEHQGRIVRPLMPFFKDELLDYAHRKGLSYIEDETNYQAIYTRNKIRLEILPVIEQHFPTFRQVLLRHVPLYREASELLDEVIEKKLRRLIQQIGDRQQVPLARLRSHPTLHLLLRRWLQPFGFSSDQIIHLARSLDLPPGSQFLSPTHRLVFDRQFLILTEHKPEAPAPVLITENDQHIVLPHGTLTLHIREPDTQIPDDPHQHWLDRDLLHFPLLLRPWKAGDYFYPLGMNRKKKKVSDFLTDKKQSLLDKENTWVLLSGEKICCVLGHRIDHRFRITPSTRQALILLWQPSQNSQG
ncbi:MAG: tRNA lysidine(34) synthetase TilS [Chitinophagales bacterium]|nr:tRNA lysidine(34) synthetase TilS [Chitinophagales bacterium]MDW8428341.1 tRNA lysidine(34) synthetase TilS [Chitinophagales bacterium]